MKKSVLLFLAILLICFCGCSQNSKEITPDKKTDNKADTQKKDKGTNTNKQNIKKADPATKFCSKEWKDYKDSPLFSDLLKECKSLFKDCEKQCKTDNKNNCLSDCMTDLYTSEEGMGEEEVATFDGADSIVFDNISPVFIENIKKNFDKAYFQYKSQITYLAISYDEEKQCINARVDIQCTSGNCIAAHCRCSQVMCNCSFDYHNTYDNTVYEMMLFKVFNNFQSFIYGSNSMVPFYVLFNFIKSDGSQLGLYAYSNGNKINLIQPIEVTVDGETHYIKSVDQNSETVTIRMKDPVSGNKSEEAYLFDFLNAK